MYEPDGSETVVRFTREDEAEYQLAVDAEDYARMLNDGWVAIEEVRSVTRDVITEEMFRSRGGE